MYSFPQHDLIGRTLPCYPTRFPEPQDSVLSTQRLALCNSFSKYWITCGLPHIPLNAFPLTGLAEVHKFDFLISSPFPHRPMTSASRNAILRLINASQHTACPCHGCRAVTHAHNQLKAINHLRNFATPVHAIEKEYAFEVCREGHSSIFYVNSARLLLPTSDSAMVLLPK